MRAAKDCKAIDWTYIEEPRVQNVEQIPSLSSAIQYMKCLIDLVNEVVKALTLTWTHQVAQMLLSN